MLKKYFGVTPKPYYPTQYQLNKKVAEVHQYTSPKTAAESFVEAATEAVNNYDSYYWIDQSIESYTSLLDWAMRQKFSSDEEEIHGMVPCPRHIEPNKTGVDDRLEQRIVHDIYPVLKPVHDLLFSIKERQRDVAVSVNTLCLALIISLNAYIKPEDENVLFKDVKDLDHFNKIKSQIHQNHFHHNWYFSDWPMYMYYMSIARRYQLLPDDDMYELYSEMAHIHQVKGTFYNYAIEEGGPVRYDDFIEWLYLNMLNVYDVEYDQEYNFLLSFMGLCDFGRNTKIVDKYNREIEIFSS